jgi:transposase
MVTIAWNPLGFHLLEVLPNGSMFNTEYYRDNIRTALIQFLLEPGVTRLVLHADDTRPHTAQKCGTFFAENGLWLATHAPSSPDLTPSDFFLFKHVKNRLQGIVFQSQEELLAEIREVLDEIRSKLWSASSSIGWRDSNGFLRIMMIIIHQLNIR